MTISRSSNFTIFWGQNCISWHSNFAVQTKLLILYHFDLTARAKVEFSTRKSRYFVVFYLKFFAFPQKLFFVSFQYRSFLNSTAKPRYFHANLSLYPQLCFSFCSLCLKKSLCCFMNVLKI